MGFKKHNGPPPKGTIGPRVMYLSKLVRQTANKTAAQQGLFSGQQDIVMHLIKNEGMTVSELANKLEVSTATASISVKRMEKAGFIAKKPDKTDARIVRLYPTEKAKAAPEAIRKKLDGLETILKKNMTQEQVLELSALLDTAIDNLLERGDDID